MERLQITCIGIEVTEGYRGNGSDTSSMGHMTLEPQSTGFIMTGPGSEVNSSTGKFMYCAWAEQPAFNLFGGQSNAQDLDTL